MTSSDLLDLISGLQFVKDRQIQVTPDDVYLAATFAQRDACLHYPLLESRGSLGIVAGTDSYVFSPVSVTGATSTAPIVLPFASAHPFNTGDRVFVSGVLGLLSANGEFTVTKVDSTHISLDGSDGTAGPAWTAGGTVYHCLIAASQILQDQLYMRSGNDRFVVKRRTATAIALNERSFSDQTRPVFFEEIFGTSLTVRFQGTPSAAHTLYFPYRRIPLPSEKISATVDPILPASYDTLLTYATQFFLFDLIKSGEASASEWAKVAMQKYQAMAQREAIEIAKRRFVGDVDYTSLRFQ